MWQNIGEGQATDDNLAYELCTLDTLGYKHTQFVRLTAFPMQKFPRERASVLRYT
jgi:hypothetical protein